MPDPRWRLGRIYTPDPRDHDWPFDLKLPAPTTTPTGRRLWNIPVRYNQGDTDDCTAYSTAAAETGRLATFGGPAVGFNAARLYEWANTHDGIPQPHDGSTVRAAFQGMVTEGALVTSTAWTGHTRDPYPVGDDVRATNYLWADLGDIPAALDHLAAWVLAIGPAVVGIPWYDSMYCQDDNGNFTAPTGGILTISGNIDGGHAICVRGVDADRGLFVLRNSWQPWGILVESDWSVNLAHGDGGDILITRTDLGSLLAQQGEAGALVTDTITVGS